MTYRNRTLLDLLGLNTPRWHWRRMRWERALRTFFRAPLHAGGFSVSRAILVANLTLFTLVTAKGLTSGLGFFGTLLNPDPYLLLFGGAQYWPLVLIEGEWWRCLTYAFAHGGVIHIAFNMMVLNQIGPMVEFEIGRTRFIVLYVLTALLATFAGYFWHPLAPVVGASGALFGLIGFAVAWYHRLGDFQSLEIRNFMLRWAAFSFAFGLLVGADNAAHLGGAIGGATFGYLLPQRQQRRFDRLFNVLAAICSAAVVIALGQLVYSWLGAGRMA